MSHYLDNNCPACGRRLSGNTGIGHDHQPKAGDVTVCIYCAQVHEYREDLSLRPIDLSDVDADIRSTVEDVVRAVHRRLAGHS